MPNPNNIYSRLTKGVLRNGKEMASLQLKQTSGGGNTSEFKFYHVANSNDIH